MVGWCRILRKMWWTVVAISVRRCSLTPGRRSLRRPGVSELPDLLVHRRDPAQLRLLFNKPTKPRRLG
jgi:hypothetical protein